MVAGLLDMILQHLPTMLAARNIRNYMCLDMLCMFPPPQSCYRLWDVVCQLMIVSRMVWPHRMMRLHSIPVLCQPCQHRHIN